MSEHQPKLVLLVDDHPDLVEVMAEWLTLSCDQDLAIDIGRNGLEAVAMAIARPPAVAILDIDMPLMNGLDAAIEIRRRLGKSAPLLIAVTGNEIHLHAGAVLATFDHVLTKPIDLYRLAELLDCSGDA